jgi:hypothetical protein
MDKVQKRISFVQDLFNLFNDHRQNLSERLEQF